MKYVCNARTMYLARRMTFREESAWPLMPSCLVRIEDIWLSSGTPIIELGAWSISHRNYPPFVCYMRKDKSYINPLSYHWRTHAQHGRKSTHNMHFTCDLQVGKDSRLTIRLKSDLTHQSILLQEIYASASYTQFSHANCLEGHARLYRTSHILPTSKVVHQ